MKKLIIPALALAIPALLSAQSAIDAASITRGDLRGTARFMSMGGAFTALGGDMSSLNQNPAGIGVYRSSDISVTLDINDSSVKGMTNTESKTNVACNSFGYVGTVNLGSSSIMPFFNWGASYSRVATFDRRYSTGLGNIGTSLSNFVADYTTNDGYTGSELLSGDYYNPYMESWAPWTSVLMYNGGAINELGTSTYTGMYDYDRTYGTAATDVVEKGYIDEYSINFGGNIDNVVFWGLGFGITDLNFKQESYYNENLTDAIVPGNNWNGTAYGNANVTLGNYKHIWGSGFNVKLGLIIKPVNELRLGFAVHTPTYYNLSYEGLGSLDFNYTSSAYTDGKINGSIMTDDGYLDNFDWKCRTPWRLMVGAAGVVGGKAIISADYEYRPAQATRVLDFNGDSYKDVNSDIKNYLCAQNILRLGAEYRVTPSFSIRAGYSYESSPVKQETMDGDNYIYTSGPDDTETQPAFTLDKDTQYITLGLGYRYKNFYADAAYVHRQRDSKYCAFTNYVDNEDYFVEAPSCNLRQTNNSVVLTVGFRF